jgi:hypothetical protein
MSTTNQTTETTTKIDEYEAKLGKLPAQVREVAEAWLACAMRTAEMMIVELGEVGDAAEQTRKFWAERIFIHRTLDEAGVAWRWEISDNHERCAALVYHPSTSVAPADAWQRVPMYRDGRVMQGGHAEALASAEIVWHG